MIRRPRLRPGGAVSRRTAAQERYPFGLLMIITVAFLVTPESYHQIVEVGADTGRFHRLISRMAGFSLLPFALSLGIALFITGERIFGFSAGLAAGCFFALLALGCWYGLQYLRRLQTGHKERAISARQQTVMETTPLDEHITQMLTEARVVLPGVQALLGFQLASVISQSFERLPASSKTVHATSLGCIAVLRRPLITALSSRVRIPKRYIASEVGSSPVPLHLWPLGSLVTSTSSSPRSRLPR
jgi:Family of unknown function (DUF6328)